MMELIEWVDPSTDDQLVFLGDYVNRGPDSYLVLDWLMENSRRRPMVCLRGNHEIMLMQERGHKLDKPTRKFI